MRSIEQDDDIAVWVLLSALWSLAGLLVWLGSMLFSSSTSGETLAFLALVTFLTGVILRLPVLTHWIEQRPEQRDAPAASGTPSELLSPSARPDGRTMPANVDASLYKSTSAAFAQWLRQLEDDWIFAGVLVGGINWLGALLLHCPSVLDAVPILLIATALEGWMVWQLANSGLLATWQSRFGDSGLPNALPKSVKNHRMNAKSHLPSESTGPNNLTQGEHSLANALSADKTSTNPTAGSLQDSNVHFSGATATNIVDSGPGDFGLGNFATLDSETVDKTSENFITEAADSEAAVAFDVDSNIDSDIIVTRSCQDALDPTGKRFLSGDVLVRMDEGQSKAECVIGFCPAFQNAPDAEVEVLDESFQARVVNCTPSGMRIALRRSGSRSQSDDVRFEWFASDSSVEDCSVPERPALP